MGIRTTVPALLFASVAAATESPAIPVPVPEVLPDGTRAFVHEVPTSPHVVIVTWVPHGLCGDGKGQTQWSHLLEHLVVTTPETKPNWQEINAETLPDGMHLDFIRAADRWKEGIRAHARWLHNPRITNADVAREVPRVLQETQQVAQRGFTGKFAMAAWAQAMAHGSAKVEVLGDVRRAKAKDLAEEYRRRFLAGRHPVIAVYGKFDRKVVLAELKAAFPKRDPAPTRKVPFRRAEEPPAQVAWDLPTSHAVLSWRLPEKVSEEQDVILWVAAQCLRTKLMMFRPPGTDPQAFLPVVSDQRLFGHRYFVIDVRLAGKEADLDALRAAVLKQLRSITERKSEAWRWSMNQARRAADARNLHARRLKEGKKVGRFPLRMQLGNLAVQFVREQFHRPGGEQIFLAGAHNITHGTVQAQLRELLDPKTVHVLRIQPGK